MNNRALTVARAAWNVAAIRSKGRYKRSLIGDLWPLFNNLAFAFILGPIYATVRGNISDVWLFVGYLGYGAMTWDLTTRVVTTSLGFAASNRNFLIDSNIPVGRLILIEYMSMVRDYVRSVFCFSLILGIFNHKLWIYFFVGCAQLLPLLFLLYSLCPYLALVGGQFPDIKRLMPICFRVMFLSLPILYLPGTLSRLPVSYLLMNPFYQIVSMARSSFMGLEALSRLSHSSVYGTLPMPYLLFVVCTLSASLYVLGNINSAKIRSRLVLQALK